MNFSQVCMYVLTASTAIAQTEPPKLAELEKTVLDYRRVLVRGHLVFAQRTPIHSGMATPDEKRKTAIWFDGNRIRNDVTTRNKEDESLHREIQCRNCECDNCYVNFWDEKKDGVPIALSLNRMRADYPPNTYLALDPRLLGLVVDNSPDLALSRSRLDSRVGAPNRQHLTMQRVSWKGMDCQRIDYSFPRGKSKARIWIVPNWGPSVGRIEIEREASGHHYLEFVESDYQQFGKAETWFPKTCVWEQQIDGKAFEREEVVVEVQSLNEPLPADTFRLAGMDIPVGWPISGYRIEGMSTWKGNEIEAKAPPAPPKPPPTPRNIGWIYAVNAIGLAVVAAWAIWSSFRKRKLKAPPPG